jgi:stage II sporulation protein Q
MNIIKKHGKYLLIVLFIALFLGGIGIIQNVINQKTDFEDETVVKVEENDKTETNKAQTVEVLKKPVDDSIGIVRYFYSVDDDSSKQEQSLILFENVYRPNLGIDFSDSDKEFDVYASISG